jgi:sugar phosphate isomerase/epimerase
MPGDGVIDVKHLRRCVEQQGYRGAVEIEILSRHWWARDPDEVLAICKDRYMRFC